MPSLRAFLRVAGALLVVAAVGGGCDQTPRGPGGYLHATVDGERFSAVSAGAIPHLVDDSYLRVRAVASVGTDGQRRSVDLVVPAAEGTADENSASVRYEERASTGVSAIWVAGLGEGRLDVRVTHVSAERIDGTFSATVRSTNGEPGTIEIEGGRFSVDIPGVPLF